MSARPHPQSPVPFPDRSRLPSGGIRLPAGKVHVWRASLELPEKRIPELSSLLSRTERDRADRFQLDHLKPRYVAAHAILRILLGRYLGTEPEDISFSYSEKGKPMLVAEHNAPASTHSGDIRFNMSDSNVTALFAFARGADVGVDLETLRALNDMNALARTVFTPDERDRLERIPERHRLKAFFQAWTVKEAALKATGEGLRGLHRVETLLGVEDGEDGGSGRPVFGVNEIRDPQASSWTVHLLDPAPDFAAAVALPAGGFIPRTFDAEGILD